MRRLSSILQFRLVICRILSLNRFIVLGANLILGSRSQVKEDPKNFLLHVRFLFVGPEVCRRRTDVIPPHDGHPCLKLTTTATFVVRDFHP
ncbi:MAG: hypothetical protein ACPL5F_12055 [Moorellaceae bacterium]